MMCRMTKRSKIDKAGAKLLNAVQRNNRLTSEELAEVAGLSATACQRRLQKFRQDGVIESDVSVLSPKAVGRALSMMVLVSMERERADIIDKFKHSIRNTPEIMNGYYVTGDADFVLLITAQNMEEYEEFTRKFFYKNADIRSVKTLVVMDRVKTGFNLPVKPDEDD